jgi:hypothetical protein
MAGGGNDFSQKIQPFKLFGNPLGSLNNVGLALRFGTYAGNPQELA